MNRKGKLVGKVCVNTETTPMLTLVSKVGDKCGEAKRNKETKKQSNCVIVDLHQVNPSRVSVGFCFSYTLNRKVFRNYNILYFK